MDVRNCRQCGRLFNYLGGPPICQACREAVEEKFQQVKEYVRNNPGSNIQMVAEDNDVTVQQIRQWIREERLEFSADSQVGIECEGCGASIRTGRFVRRARAVCVGILATRSRNRSQKKIYPRTRLCVMQTRCVS